MKLSTLIPFSLLAQTIASPLSTRQEIRYALTEDAATVAKSTYDYIVVGGGLTGLTVASRLSEDPSITVLVIEGGKNDHHDPRVHDVRTYGAAFGSELDYNLTSTPVASQNNTGLILVAGQTLGGSGSINGASWTKGSKTQYDLLPFLTGDDSWGWESFNQFMLQAENFHEPSRDQINKGAKFDKRYHGKNGPVKVSFAAGIFDSIQEEALEASQKVWPGLQRVSDFAAGITSGTTIIPNMVEPTFEQNRSSPFTAYTQNQISIRDNLVILTGHRVIEINWKNQTGPLTAEGVKFQAHPTSTIYNVKCHDEVLLAAGSLQSPQLLELSGVGNPDVLTPANIPIRHASPNVGKNMQEQTKNTLLYRPRNPSTFTGTGPPSSTAWPNIHHLFPSNTTALHTTILSSLPAHCTSLQTRNLITNATATLQILTTQVNELFTHNTSSAAEIFFTTDPNTGTVGADIWGLIVLSRGTAHVRSADPWDHAVYEPGYFGSEFDVRVQAKAVEQAAGVFETEPLRGLVGERVLPRGEVGDWEGWVRGSFTSVWHYIGTVGMMREELGGVVDGRLRVYGVGNVRCVDASVLPVQLSAHLSSSLYGIAEKGAVMIREDRGKRRE